MEKLRLGGVRKYAQGHTVTRRARPEPLQVTQVSVCLFYTYTYRFGVLDEDLGAPHLVLVWLHVDSSQQVLDPLTLIPPPLWPRLGGQNGIPGGRGLGELEEMVQVEVILRGGVRAKSSRGPHLCRNLANWRR